MIDAFIYIKDLSEYNEIISESKPTVSQEIDNVVYEGRLSEDGKDFVIADFGDYAVIYYGISSPKKLFREIEQTILERRSRGEPFYGR